MPLPRTIETDGHRYARRGSVTPPSAIVSRACSLCWSARTYPAWSLSFGQSSRKKARRIAAASPSPWTVIAIPGCTVPRFYVNQHHLGTKYPGEREGLAPRRARALSTKSLSNTRIDFALSLLECLSSQSISTSASPAATQWRHSGRVFDREGHSFSSWTVRRFMKSVTSAIIFLSALEQAVLKRRCQL